MKVIICCINSKYIHSSLAPWCLLAGVKEYCEKNITAKVTEGTINEKEDEIFDRVITEKPDVVGFCTYIWNVSRVLSLASKIKHSYPNIKIILGGPEVSYNAEELLCQNKDIDYIISGDGEKPFSVLLNYLVGGTNLQKDLGICYKNNDKIIVSNPYICDEEPISPYVEEYFEALKGRIAYIETSRGCPYSCAFCLSGRCGNVRFFDMKKSKQNILKIANSGTKTVKFVDRTFNANAKRAKEIISFIIENYGKEIPCGVCFHFEIAGDILDEETICLLNTAPKGSVQLEIGLQSFNEETLSYINRKTNTQRLKNNIRRLIEPRNIHIHIDLIAGLPFENLESFKDSFNIAFALKPDMLQLGFLKLLHGADMREDTQKYPCEFSDLPPYEVIETPFMSQADFMLLHNLEDSLERVYNSHRFSRTLDYVLNASEIEAFDFFNLFSQHIYSVKTDNIGLNEYTALLFEYLCTVKGVKKSVLRDKMVCDRLASNSSGVLPQCLKVDDSMLKKYKNALNSLIGINSTGKRGIAILYSESKLVYTDYIEKDAVIGEYSLNYVSFDTLL